ncbi:MAG: RHS repeat domain-containing protein [Bacteroidota bacterium]
MKLSFLFFITFYSLCFAGQQEKKILKKEVQEGFTIGAKGELVSDQSRVIKIYNERGVILEESNERFWPQMQKTATFKKVFHYNDFDSVAMYELYNDTAVALKLEMHYDSTHTLFETQEINSKGGKGFSSKKIRNEKKWMVAEELYKPDGTFYSRKEYIYDEHGNLIEEFGKEGGQLKYRWKYKYDKQHRLIERKDFNGAEQLLRTHKYEYNSDKKIKEEVILQPNGAKEKVVKYSYEYW